MEFNIKQVIETVIKHPNFKSFEAEMEAFGIRVNKIVSSIKPISITAEIPIIESEEEISKQLSSAFAQKKKDFSFFFKPPEEYLTFFEELFEKLGKSKKEIQKLKDNILLFFKVTKSGVREIELGSLKETKSGQFFKPYVELLDIPNFKAFAKIREAAQKFAHLQIKEFPQNLLEKYGLGKEWLESPETKTWELANLRYGYKDKEIASMVKKLTKIKKAERLKEISKETQVSPTTTETKPVPKEEIQKPLPQIIEKEKIGIEELKRRILYIRTQFPIIAKSYLKKFASLEKLNENNLYSFFETLEQDAGKIIDFLINSVSKAKISDKDEYELEEFINNILDFSEFHTGIKKYLQETTEKTTPTFENIRKLNIKQIKKIKDDILKILNLEKEKKGLPLVEQDTSTSKSKAVTQTTKTEEVSLETETQIKTPEAKLNIEASNVELSIKAPQTTPEVGVSKKMKVGVMVKGLWPEIELMEELSEKLKNQAKVQKESETGEGLLPPSKQGPPSEIPPQKPFGSEEGGEEESLRKRIFEILMKFPGLAKRYSEELLYINKLNKEELSVLLEKLKANKNYIIDLTKISLLSQDIVEKDGTKSKKFIKEIIDLTKKNKEVKDFISNLTRRDVPRPKDLFKLDVEKLQQVKIEVLKILDSMREKEGETTVLESKVSDIKDEAKVIKGDEEIFISHLEKLDDIRRKFFETLLKIDRIPEVSRNQLIKMLTAYQKFYGKKLKVPTFSPEEIELLPLKDLSTVVSLYDILIKQDKRLASSKYEMLKFSEKWIDYIEEINKDEVLRQRIEQGGVKLKEYYCDLNLDELHLVEKIVEERRKELNIANKIENLKNKAYFLMREKGYSEEEIKETFKILKTYEDYQKLLSHLGYQKKTVDFTNQHNALLSKANILIKTFATESKQVGLNQEFIKEASDESLKSKIKETEILVKNNKLNDKKLQLANKIVGLEIRLKSLSSETYTRFKKTFADTKFEGLNELQKYADVLKNTIKTEEQRIKEKKTEEQFGRRSISLNNRLISLYGKIQESKELQNKLTQEGFNLSSLEIFQEQVLKGSINERLNTHQKTLGYLEKEVNVYNKISKVQDKRKNLEDYIIGQVRETPELLGFLNIRYEDLNEMTYDELKRIRERISAINAERGARYRSRLEIDRVASGMKWFGIVSSAFVSSLMKGAVDYSLALNRLTVGYNIPMEKSLLLTGISNATRVSVDSLTEAIGNFYQKLLTAGQGTSFVAARVREALQFAGISAIKLGERAESPIVALEKLRRLFEKIQDPATRAYIGQMVLGDQYEKMLPILTATSKQYEILSGFFKMYTGVTEEAIFNSVLLNAQLSAIAQTSKILGVELLNSISDPIQFVRESLSNLYNLVNILPKGLKEFTSLMIIFIPTTLLFISWILKLYTDFHRLLDLETTLSGFFRTILNWFDRLAESLRMSSTMLLGYVTALTALGTAITFEVASAIKLRRELFGIGLEIRSLEDRIKDYDNTDVLNRLTANERKRIEELKRNIEFYREELEKTKEATKGFKGWILDVFGMKGRTSFPKYKMAVAEELQKYLKEYEEIIVGATNKIEVNLFRWKEILSGENVLIEIASDQSKTLNERFLAIENTYNKLTRYAETYSAELDRIQKSYTEAIRKIHEEAKSKFSEIYNSTNEQLKLYKRVAEYDKNSISGRFRAIELEFELQKEKTTESYQILEKARTEDLKRLRIIMENSKKLIEQDKKFLKDLKEERDKANKEGRKNDVRTIITMIDQRKRDLKLKETELNKTILEMNAFQEQGIRNAQIYQTTLANLQAIKNKEILELTRELQQQMNDYYIEYGKQRLKSLQDFYKEGLSYATKYLDIDLLKSFLASYNKTLIDTYDIQLNEYMIKLKGWGKSHIEIEKYLQEKKNQLAKEYAVEYYRIYTETLQSLLNSERLNDKNRLEIMEKYIKESKNLIDKDMANKSLYGRTLIGFLNELQNLEKRIRLLTPYEYFVSELEKITERTGSLLNKFRTQLVKEGGNFISQFLSSLASSFESGSEDIVKNVENFIRKLVFEVITQTYLLNKFQENVRSSKTLQEALGKTLADSILTYMAGIQIVAEATSETFSFFSQSLSKTNRSQSDYYKKISEDISKEIKETFALSKTEFEAIPTQTDILIDISKVKKSISDQLSLISSEIFNLDKVNIKADLFYLQKLEKLDLEVKELKIIPDSISILNQQGAMNGQLQSGLNEKPESKQVSVANNVNFYGINFDEALERMKNTLYNGIKLKEFLEGATV